MPSIGSAVEVYAAVAAPLVRTLLAGTNATLFAYGQTGRGREEYLHSFLPSLSFGRAYFFFASRLLQNVNAPKSKYKPISVLRYVL